MHVCVCVSVMGKVREHCFARSRQLSLFVASLLDMLKTGVSYVTPSKLCRINHSKVIVKAINKCGHDGM